jgi:hypothetical protein
VFGQKTKQQGPPQPAGLFTFSGLLSFSENFSSGTAAPDPFRLANGRIASLAAVLGAEKPFNRLKAPSNLHDHKNDNRQSRQNRRCGLMSRQNPCKSA